MRPLSELTQEAEETFSTIALHRTDIQDAFQQIVLTIDKALEQHNLSMLQSLIPHIEKGSGYLAYQYIGKTHRVLRLLHIIDLEIKLAQTPFSDGCSSFDALWNKYMLSVFALRRLQFYLSDTSVSEAVSFLQLQPLSYLAAYILVQEELSVSEPEFYETIAEIHSEFWTEDNIKQFYILANIK